MRKLYREGVNIQLHSHIRRVGVASATTCEFGTTPRTSPILLERFIDRDDFDDIEIKAGICAVPELIRELPPTLRPLSSLQPTVQHAGS